ncbi:MAG: S41 family peptidase [Flavobacteriaceae bacterium]|nr:S41 family peptidase [Flavobacteriaceae bacterium]
MKIKLVILFLLILGLGLTVGMWVNPKISLNQQNALIESESIKKIDDYFNEVASLNSKKNQIQPIIEQVINEIFKNLDPHSSYIPNTLNQAFMEEMIGEFEGIGIRFSIIQDTVTVLQVFENGPSNKAGLLSGDRIVHIGKTSIDSTFLSQNDVTQLLKGPAKTQVGITVYRKQLDSLFDVEILRDKVDIPSVTSSYMIDSETGYIKLEQFSETTFEEFGVALRELIMQKINHLIIDLRNNPGGILQQAIDLGDLLLSPDSPIVIVESNNGEKITYKAESVKGFYGKLYILVNENSASASEILAGAIQDNHRGLVIGNRTYGKGLVQYQTKIADADYLRLTTSRFYTPSGRSIQKPYKQGILNEPFEFEMIPITKELPEDSLKQTESESHPQNLDTLHYQGGIIPDMDTNNVLTEEETITEQMKSIYYNTLLIDSFLLDHMPYNNIVTLESKALFFSKPLPDEDLYFEKFLNYIEGYIYIDTDVVRANKKSTITAIKAHIGRLFFNEDVYHRIKNSDDIYVNTVLEEIAKSK